MMRDAQSGGRLLLLDASDEDAGLRERLRPKSFAIGDVGTTLHYYYRAEGGVNEAEATKE